MSTSDNSQGIRILSIIENEVGSPRNDGTRGSALYSVPLQLSRTPSSTWAQLFAEVWDHPPQYTSMHRPGNARVRGDQIVFAGTTLEELERYHLETLTLVVNTVNARIADHDQELAGQEQQAQVSEEEHRKSVSDAVKRIRFD